jgi:hypothetical protein
MHLEDAARICHEINLVYALSLGDTHQYPWDQLPQHVKDSVIHGVQYRLLHPDLTPAQSHQAWVEYKLAEGWIYGPVKDYNLKTHPSLVPFDQLPPSEQVKDHLFTTLVHLLRPWINPATI